MQRRTKILCTIGPATADVDKLVALIENGMDVARLNFSHGTHDDHRQMFENIRTASEQSGKPIAILQDLQGPKIRTRKVRNGIVFLSPGSEFVITADDVEEGDEHRVSTTYKDLIKEVSAGDTLLLDDGYLILKVKDVVGNDIITEVIKGGNLKNNKGIIAPGVKSNAPSLSEKDIEDLKFGLELGVDYVALSFVRSAKDVLELKTAMKIFKKNVGIISKIERFEACERIEEIIEESDGIMVARGDLGLETPAEEVPILQKNIIKKCNYYGKPVIVATQMLESMISNPRPTRAEASDVANAVIDGTDCVMLSGETSTGQYPIEAVNYMDRIIRTTEKHFHRMLEPKIVPIDERHNFSDALSKASCEVASQVNASAIIAMTTSGFTAINIAKYRPKQEIIAFTELQSTQRKLSLIWGVRSFWLEQLQNSDDIVQTICNFLLSEGIFQKGEKIIFVTGTSEKTSLPENVVKIMKL